MREKTVLFFTSHQIHIYFPVELKGINVWLFFYWHHSIFNLGEVAAGKSQSCCIAVRIMCVYCMNALNPVWSRSYRSVWLWATVQQLNYVWVWSRVVLLSVLWPVCLLCLCCRWWSLPGTTTSATPGGRMSCGLWPKTGTLATCLVSVSWPPGSKGYKFMRFSTFDQSEKDLFTRLGETKQGNIVFMFCGIIGKSWF